MRRQDASCSESHADVFVALEGFSAALAAELDPEWNIKVGRAASSRSGESCTEH